ncbi:MAG TPA: GNAT family N-acetyltransferase [Microbacterium sp.]|nr:GNAT family N-acetyltransferase [Microbacterium sp.]
MLVRPAEPDDIPGLAHVHVQGWRETYRGLFPDQLLDDPEFEPRRRRFWTTVFADPRYADHRVAVAEDDGEVVGFGLASPDGDELGIPQLYALYLLAAHQGSGAGSQLLDAVLDPDDRAVLWVADPNPRAQAFYRRHRFTPDGVEKVEDGVREIRMQRPAR